MKPRSPLQVRPAIFGLILGAVVTLLGGCCDDDEDPKATSPAKCGGLACEVSCRSADDCGAGQVCNGGFCENPLDVWRACVLDADCFNGDYCKLGDCSHDCLSSRDCDTGLVCDVRGRCIAPERAGTAPPPALPQLGGAVLKLSATTVDIEDTSSVSDITLINSGGEDLEFVVHSDQRWLDVQPASGSALGSGEEQVLELRVDPQLSVGGEAALVTVLSSGGSRTFNVTIPPRLEGLFHGALAVREPMALGSRPLGLFLAEDDDGAVSGTVDVQASPLVAFKAPVTGQVTRTGEGPPAVELSISIPARAGSKANPSFDVDLQRTLSFSGHVDAQGGIVGSFTESIEGFSDEPLLLRGDAALSLTSADAVAPSPAMADDVSPPGALEPSWAGCGQCPSGACPEDPLDAAREFLAVAFPFYEAYATTGYLAVAECIDGQAICIDPNAVKCAQKYFFDAWRAGDERPCTLVVAETQLEVPDCARRGLLDAFKGVSAWHLLAGNELLVRAHRPGLSLTAARASTAAADAAFRKALYGDPSGAHGPLHPYFAGWLGQLAAEYSGEPHVSLLPEVLSVTGTTTPAATAYEVPPHGDLDRLGIAMASSFGARLRQLQIDHRLRSTDDALRGLAEKSATEAHLTLAVLGSYETAAQANLGVERVALAAEALSKKAADIQGGLNPAGLPASYIAYNLKPAEGMTTTNFEARLEAFKQGDLQAVEEAFGRAESATRGDEGDFQSLARDLTNDANSYRQRMLGLCGISTESELDECGAASGEVYQALQELAAAGKRGELAADAIDKVYAQIEIEENRAAEIARIHTNRAHLILENGQKIAALDAKAREAERKRARKGGMFKAATSIVSSIGNLAKNPQGLAGGWGVALQAGAGAADALFSADQQAKSISFNGQIEAEKQHIITMERAQVEFDTADEISIDSKARIKTWMLEIPALQISSNLAAIDCVRAGANLKLLLQQVADARSMHDRLLELTVADPRGRPDFRIVRDAAVRELEETFDRALASLFLLTRAFEYELNVSYGPSGSLFSLTTLADLRTYVSQLETAFDRRDAKLGTPARYEHKFSLRDDILRTQIVPDAAFGTSSSPSDHLRRFLADPRNRDEDGNIEITFSFLLSPGETAFNEGFCADRIVSLGASVVGDDLGVARPELKLKQVGSAYLRECDGALLLREYDLESTLGVRDSIIQAGVNLTGFDDMRLNLNPQLFGRPVSATYELVIDLTQPANEGLELENVQDIELYLHHEAWTAQH